MLLGRVIGTVVPALLVDELASTPLLWIQPLDREGQPEGEPLVCADGTRMAYATVGQGLCRQRRPQAAHRYRMMES